MIKIIVADDHIVMRNGITALLEKVDDFEIIGEAANGIEVIELLDKGVIPDIILTDLNMPGMGGIQLCEAVQQKKIPVKLILLTMLDHEKFVVKAFKAGINGYLLKNVTVEEMIFGIRQIYRDGRYICSELAVRFLDRLVKTPIFQETDKPLTEVSFSSREIEILDCMAEGFTNQEIADKLFTSKRTVEGHRQAMLEKTETRNSAALIKYAVLNGIIS
jgi:DNA-binding NarL/FixJ family response regulator